MKTNYIIAVLTITFAAIGYYWFANSSVTVENMIPAGKYEPETLDPIADIRMTDTIERISFCGQEHPVQIFFVEGINVPERIAKLAQAEYEQASEEEKPYTFCGQNNIDGFESAEFYTAATSAIHSYEDGEKYLAYNVAVQWEFMIDPKKNLIFELSGFDGSIYKEFGPFRAMGE